ncbi:MAG TPA: GDP-L-fucose synthase [Flavobacteriales bacterium]|jgi:GDP-L-fucose synthase|nr:GDP-L-fucose synthase [Flavobacteriales bacterium]HIB77511.1 GDP-L-fucose synthase [Flavobacteriales bacterium]HIN41505.1 GDP-L-fucose synthase [Flavobacteriales bacterium]
MNPNKLIYVAGHRGMVGAALVRALESRGEGNIITRTSEDLDLRDRNAVDEFFATKKPQIVYLAAAKVGGIHANATYPAEFFFDNLSIATNVIDSAYKHGVEKLLFLGSSCIYPRLAPQPIPENALLTGPLEPTNEPYALAKIAGLKLCDAYRKQYGCNFISAMPTNLYGPGDNYHPENSHVLPAFIRRFHEAVKNGEKEVVCWGSGTPKREFLHVKDLADGLLHLMDHHDSEGWVNIGTGIDLSIGELATTIAEVVGFKGEIVWDSSKPDGAPRKLLNVSKMSEMGWDASIKLKDGIESVYADYVSNGK